MPFVSSQIKEAAGLPAAGIAAFLPPEGADAAHVGTVNETAVRSIEIDHGAMPADDAAALIIRAGPIQGRKIRAACHPLFHRNTREFRLGHDVFKHIRKRYAAKDGSCSGGRTDSGKGQSIRNARRREDAMPSGACAGRWSGSPGPAYPASGTPQAAPAHAPVPRAWKDGPPCSSGLGLLLSWGFSGCFWPTLFPGSCAVPSGIGGRYAHGAREQ